MSALVGQTIQEADFPPTVWDHDETDINNVTSTAFITGSPEVSVTFTAPTSGRVLVINGGGCRNNTGADQIFLDCEIRVGTSGGTLVRSPSVVGEGTITCADESSSHEYKSRGFVQEGLTPGTVYYAVLQYRTASGGGTADVASRSIIVQPIP